MVRFVETTEEIADTNLSRSSTKLFIGRLKDSRQLISSDLGVNGFETPFSKHNIKETDMRIKTASFTTPHQLDLTNGQYCVLITSPQFENFAGVILSEEYDEKTGLYTYQCQDWSRKHMSKSIWRYVNGSMWSLLCCLITNNGVPLDYTQKDLDAWKEHLSGLRPRSEYNQVDWGSIVNFNPMSQQNYLLIRDKACMEVIRDIVYGSGGYIDLYFNDNGILQVEPYHKKDWENTGVHIDSRDVSEVKVKFDTTNIITSAIVSTGEGFDTGIKYTNEVLRAFFGIMGTTLTNKTETKSTSSSSSGAVASNGNPYGSKAKKIWINADNGSGSMKSAVANVLKNKGWDVHVGRTGSNVHYEDYFNVTSDYQCYATLYNGFCAGTIREAYSDYIQNTLKKKGVTLVVMWDTSGWTNPQGMYPYRNGDFTGYNAGRAWDDNFSSSDPSIKNVSSWLKSKGAIYCASPTAEGIVDQFLKGGYFKSVGQ